MAYFKLDVDIVEVSSFALCLNLFQTCRQHCFLLKSASTDLIVKGSSPSTQGVEELKSIHTLPSLLLYENGVLVHIVEGMVSEV